MGYIKVLDPIALDYIDYLQPYLKMVDQWKIHYCIIPRRCDLTGKILWFKHCYKGSRYIKQIGNSDIYYIGEEEFLIWKLKQ